MEPGLLDDAAVATVRRFNRTVTQAVGALDERYLAEEGSLASARLLWEIAQDAPAGAELRRLRERLGLDSGYLSRLLRGLEEAGSVVVRVDPADGRRRRAVLTESGRARVARYDARSNTLVQSLAGRLGAGHRARLVAAMAEVDRLLTASAVVIEAADPESEDALRCLRAYYRELDRRFPVGFDADRSLPVSSREVREPHGVLLLARLHGEAVGCGSLRLHGTEPAEIKRLWVDEAVRGLGVGRRLLGELERRAAARGIDRVRLDTNAALVEAIALYRATGYVEIPPFTEEPYADFWFEKQLAQPAAS